MNNINWDLVDAIVSRARSALAGTRAEVSERNDGLVVVRLLTATADLDEDGSSKESTVAYNALRSAGLDVRDDATSGTVIGSGVYAHVFFSVYDAVPR